MRRTRMLRATALSALAALLVLSAQAGAAGSPAGKVERTPSAIWMVAMDGPRVAYVSGARIYVWNVQTGTTTVVRGSYTNATRTAVPSELAIAGSQVAWIKRVAYGNTEMGEKLYTAQVPGSATKIAQGYIFGRNDSADATGHWIAGVVGSGTTLAVSTWYSNHAATSSEKLSLVTSKGLHSIATGPGVIVAESVDGGHIAVLRSLAAWPADDPSTPTSEPSVGIYSDAGKLLRQTVLDTPVPPQPPCPDCGPDVGASTMFNSLALSGNRLVVLTQTNPETAGSTYTTKLEVYDWTTRTRLQTWPVVNTPPWGSRAPALSVSGRFAAVQGRETLQLIDLGTGKAVTIATATLYLRAMAMDRLGLVYAAPAGSRHGKLVFLPTAELTRLVG